MLTLILVVAASLYALGLRADRIHAGRAVTEPRSVEDGRGDTVRVSASVGSRADLGSVTASPLGLYRGHTARFYARQYRLMWRRYTDTKRALMSRPSVTEAIELAGATYGYTDTLWRKARCESNLNPNARNGSEASGLLQFLPSTWATTPYARFSIFSPYANALAAGWMHAHHRGNEWSCR